VDVNRIQQQRIDQMIRSLSSSCLSVKNIKQNYIQSSSAIAVKLREPKPKPEPLTPNFAPYFSANLDKSELLQSIDSISPPIESADPSPSTEVSTLFTEDYITSYVPELHVLPIEYKKVQASYFNTRYSRFDAVEIPFEFTGRYIAKELIQKLELGKSDTTVVNIGTGDGKSFTANRLIKFYAENGYIVIVAFPFILLTGENFGKIKKSINPNISIVNYKNLDQNNLEEYVKANVHCITINCLMGNAGEDKKGQLKVKKQYLSRLQEYCAVNHKEVILFFDEIHAGIYNFNPKRTKELNGWKTLVKKVFVLSATFTEASFIVLGMLAKKLTNYKMTIYNCERRKFPMQANLHLNITKQRYTSKDISPLFYLKRIIEEALSKNHQVNILVATRSLTDALTNPDSDEPLAKYICSLNLRKLVGNVDAYKDQFFDSTGSNIGTTFSTGLSISDSKNTFIIITPVFSGPDSQKLASIFMNGSPAITQAFARLRNGGDLHVFMSMPTHLISGSYLDKAPEFLTDLKKAFYRDCNRQTKIVENAYRSHNKHIRNLAAYGRIDWDRLHHRKREEFILMQSQYELAANYESFGKKVNPFIIWAACHDQFTNCTLKTINLIAKQTEPTVKVEIAEDTIIPDLRKLLSDDIGSKISVLSYKEALDLMFNQIHIHKENGVFDSQWKEIIYRGKSVSREHSKYHPAITKALINILYQLKYGKEVNYNCSSYILGNIFLSKCCKYTKPPKNNDNTDSNNFLNRHNNLKVAYSIWDDIREVFIRNAISEEPLFLRTIDESLEKKICTALHELRENDFYIRYKIFSFLQTYQFTIQRDGSITYSNWDITQRHTILIRALTNIFFESEDRMKKTNGKNHRVRIITAQKQLPDTPLDLTFNLTLNKFKYVTSKK